MSIITEVENVIKTIEDELASKGTSFSNIGKGIDIGIKDIKNATATGIENIALDVIESIFPQVEILVKVVDLIKSIPGYHPTDWNDPVRLQNDDNPWTNTLPGHDPGNSKSE